MKIPASLILGVGMIMVSAEATATSVNPYSYTVFKNAIKDAKWQRGYDSEKQCQGADCESTMESRSNLKYIWVNNDNNQMQFSTNGSKEIKWRSELRFLSNFNRGSSRTMTAKIGYWAGESTSQGFTVAQLHMEDSKGPPARLEIINEDKFEVTFRNDDGCTSNCWHTEEYEDTGTSGWKYIQLQTSGNYINVSVAGETYSYEMTSKWPSKGNYYWKTGIYLQDPGTVYTGYQYLYW